MDKISRREALRRTSLIIGGGALGSSIVTGVLSGCKPDISKDWIPELLSIRQADLAAELVDIILPTTSTPGAKDALVHRFIDSMMAGYLSEEDRKVIFDGLKMLEEKGFKNGTDEQKYGMVKAMAEEAQIKNDHSGNSFYVMIKEMTLLGYFTSDVGANLALNYDPIPGGYEGCISLDKAGGKTWAT